MCHIRGGAVWKQREDATSIGSTSSSEGWRRRSALRHVQRVHTPQDTLPIFSQGHTRPPARWADHGASGCLALAATRWPIVRRDLVRVLLEAARNTTDASFLRRSRSAWRFA